MGARVLVTGGSGFVGRRLCAALRAQGFEVWAPGHAELDLRGKLPRIEIGVEEYCREANHLSDRPIAIVPKPRPAGSEFRL